MFRWKRSLPLRTRNVAPLIIIIGTLFVLSGCGAGAPSAADGEIPGPGAPSLFPSGFTLNVAMDGSGTITSSPAGINCTGSGSGCSANFAAGTSVTLLAAPAAEYDLAGWTTSGTSCVADMTCTVSVMSATSVRAHFNRKKYALNVSVNGSGTVTSAPAGVACGSDCAENYTSGTSVTLTAAPASGNTFTGWSGSGIACPGTGACTVPMTAARSVAATFSPVAAGTFLLQVNLSGSGSVTSAPAGINCGADCSESYNSGTSVTLTAAPAAGESFSGWSGGGCSGTGTCTVSMTSARTTTATFAPTTFGLSVSVTGSGSVTSAPAGISCGADCSQTYTSGTSVTLTAAAASGSSFSGWSGAGCSGTGTCTVSMTAARSVSAVFAQTTFPLTVSVSGSGAVASAPTGISCGADCSENYTSGTSVTLTATPASGNSFSGWGGACAAAGTASCTVAMTAARSVTASFAAVAAVSTYTLSWDAVADARVTGYKLYFSTTPLSSGGTPSAVSLGNVTSYVFNPVAVGIPVGATVYFAVAATGSGTESALSDAVNAVIQ